MTVTNIFDRRDRLRVRAEIAKVIIASSIASQQYLDNQDDRAWDAFDLVLRDLLELLPAQLKLVR